LPGGPECEVTPLALVMCSNVAIYCRVDCLLLFRIIECFYVLLLFTAGTVSTQELSVRLTMHPSDNGGKVVANSTVVFRCMVDMSILGHDAVTWYRRQGVNRYELGTGSFRTHWSVAPRYHLETQSRTSSSVVYSLSITSMYQIIMPIFGWVFFLYFLEY